MACIAMTALYVVHYHEVEHHVAQPVYEDGTEDEDQRGTPRRRAADDLITRCREHMANIEVLLAHSRALRGQ